MGGRLGTQGKRGSATPTTANDRTSASAESGNAKKGVQGGRVLLEVLCAPALQGRNDALKARESIRERSS